VDAEFQKKKHPSLFDKSKMEAEKDIQAEKKMYPQEGSAKKMSIEELTAQAVKHAMSIKPDD
jgi:hypothetical protein